MLYNSSNLDFDIYLFIEAWLYNSIYSSELFESNLFFCFRYNRREAFRRSGNGVLISCRTSLHVQSINFDEIVANFSQVNIVGGNNWKWSQNQHHCCLHITRP